MLGRETASHTVAPAVAVPPPLVSIVIPAYNYASFLREAIESVLQQDYPRIELLVIDDGSTDGTRDLLASYGDRFWWDTQPNAGQTATLNRGWRRASGDLLAYLNADDVLAPGAVAAAVAALGAQPDAVMSYCDFAIIDIASRETARHEMRAGVDLAWLLRTGFAPFGPGSFVRRTAAEAVAGWDPSLRRVPDFDFSLRLARVGRFVHVPRVLASFRVHEASISFAAPPARLTEEAVHVIERFYATHDLPADILALRGKALAMAHVSAAQGHLRARRWGDAARCLRRAVRFHPPTLWSPFSYRLAVSGLVGQAIHRSRSRRLARQAAAAAQAAPAASPAASPAADANDHPAPPRVPRS